MPNRTLDIPRVLIMWLAVAAPAAGQATSNQPSQLLGPAPGATATEADSADRLTQLAERFASRPLPPPAPRSATSRSGQERGAPDAAIEPQAQPNQPDPFAAEQRLPGADEHVQTPIGLAAQGWGVSWLVKTSMALGVIIGIILLLRAGLLRAALGKDRRLGRNPASAVQVLQRVSIGPRSGVLLLRLGRRIIAVAESPAGLQTLAQIDDEQEIADLLQTVAACDAGSSRRAFGRLLGRFSSDYEASQYPNESSDGQELATGRARDRLSTLLLRIRTTAAKGGEA